MTTPTPLNSFETGLLVELRQHVAERAADPRPKRPPVRRRVAFATSAAAAVALTVGGLALRPDAAAAFSVEQQSDGDVMVTITDMSDADGLEQALAEHGVTADVSYNPQLLQSEPEGEGPLILRGGPGPDGENPPARVDLPAHWPGVHVEPAKGGGVTFTLAAHCIGPESVLHLTTTGSAAENLLGIFVRWQNSAC